MKKILTHWTTAFITLFVLTYIGLQDPWVKEVLRLKSFDYLLANEEVSPSKDITIITIDEEAMDYLPYMYGRTNFAVINQVDKLPVKVSDIYRKITA